MKHELITANRECDATQRLFGDYIDNTISGRDVWELERHVARCAHCSTALEQTRLTISALRNAERLDTADDFMANLHSRLDTLGPVSSKRSVMDFFKDMAAAIRGPLVVSPLRTLSVSAAAVGAIALMITLPGTLRNNAAPVGVGEAISQENLDRHVAVTASNPFDDPVAAKLEAESSVPEAVNRTAAE
jgi:Putative zinc-finger